MPPSQGQLLIGQPVTAYQDVRDVFASLGVDTTGVADYDLSGLESEHAISWRGREIEVIIAFSAGRGGGSTFPARPDDNAADALVGFDLTSKYVGAVLDQDCPHGRPEPFVFDPLEVAGILFQVRTWWPAAQAILWTVAY